MAVPPNTTEGTAVSLNPLPQSRTLDVNDSGTTYTVWYTYTATPTDNMIGLHFYGDATYIAQTFIYSPAFPDLYLIDATANINRPLQLPVTPGETYTFRIVSNTGDVGTALLHVEAEAFTDQAVPTGSFAINDDKVGFPLDLLSGTTATPIRYVPGVIAGPTGTTLADGHLLLYGYDAASLQQIAFYTSQFVEITHLPWGDFAAIGSNRADTFYVGMTSDPNHAWTATIRSFSPLGVLGQTWVLPDGGMRTLEAATDDSVAYFTQDAAGPIMRWDLVTDSALGDLAAADGTGHTIVDLLILGDGTILALAHVSMGDTVVTHYSASGTVLQTYPFGDLWEPRLASALDDPASFWLYRKPLASPGQPSGAAYFLQIRVSDGVTLATIGPTYLFPQGAYRGADALTPPARFGIATSCPFWITRADVDDGGGGGEEEPPYVAPATETDQRYIRRLRRAPHVNNDNKRVFLRTFELDLERGQGLATGQGNDPMVLLRLSRDGGQTWGEEIRMRAGALGAYTTRVLARRLGHARDTVFEVVVSDPIAWSLVGAWLDLEPGAH